MTILHERHSYDLLRKKYINLYQNVRQENYPSNQAFLITKIRFQEYVIKIMFEKPNSASIIMNCYLKLKNDKSLQKQALKTFQANV